jgi:succinyl-CoA synthetase alpha subunit
MSIFINKDTRVITQGITGKTGQFHTLGCQAYANGKNCFVAGVNPKKAGESIFNIPIYASVKEAAQQTGATAEKVTEAFKIMLKNKNVQAILVNIFGGIMKCDTIATGVIAACKAVNLQVPLVVRMKGTNEVEGKKLLADSGLPIISADTMAEAAQKVVAAVKA